MMLVYQNEDKYKTLQETISIKKSKGIRIVNYENVDAWFKATRDYMD